jgi:uncharacterized membrane protein YccF (DUF307 family)
MDIFGNIIWVVFGGILIAIEYFIGSILSLLPLLKVFSGEILLIHKDKR